MEVAGTESILLCPHRSHHLALSREELWLWAVSGWVGKKDLKSRSLVVRWLPNGSQKNQLPLTVPELIPTQRASKEKTRAGISSRMFWSLGDTVLERIMAERQAAILWVLLHGWGKGRLTSDHVMVLYILYYLENSFEIIRNISKILFLLIVYISHFLNREDQLSYNYSTQITSKIPEKPMKLMVDLNEFPGFCHSWPSPRDILGHLRPGDQVDLTVRWGHYGKISWLFGAEPT